MLRLSRAAGNITLRIECLTTFLDGRDRFIEGDIRTVSDEDGARFVGHGWALESPPYLPKQALPQAATETTLEVHRASHANKVKVKHG